jgi:hypothetical protein
MKLTRETKFGLWMAAAVVIAAAAFVIGGSLKGEEPPPYVFDTEAPAFGSDLHRLAAMSPGGFTGFEDLIPGGSRTVIGGHIIELTADSMTLETPAGTRTEMQLGETPRLARLEAGGRDLLQPGASVLVKLGATPDIAAAVLVLSAP